MNGSIRKRSKDSWELTVDLGRGPNGRRKRKYLAVKGPKSKAQQKLRELLYELDQGGSLDWNDRTLGDFLSNWLTIYAEVNTGPRTAESYRQKIQLHITPYIGGIRLTKLSPQHVQRLYSQLRDKGLSARTITHCHRTVSYTHLTLPTNREV